MKQKKRISNQCILETQRKPHINEFVAAGDVYAHLSVAKKWEQEIICFLQSTGQTKLILADWMSQLTKTERYQLLSCLKSFSKLKITYIRTKVGYQRQLILE